MMKENVLRSVGQACEMMDWMDWTCREQRHEQEEDKLEEGGGVTKNLTSIRATKSAAAVIPLKPKTAKPKPKAKKAAMEDPATYIRKRGSIPVASPTRRLFGWEFVWDPIPLPLQH
ncbi:hypothetical protein CVT25_008309 [Psilocybe cyanescens]|uniref:Uncharacterized protein n=1 Tax=Psilocybe cyanescens TaxID=93625 RepID=A0A409WUY2_PSICY|nr:hypothetical protein CVT25_008309 [Psilocybe cyanescens]